MNDMTPRTQYLLNLIRSKLVSELRAHKPYVNTFEYDAQLVKDLGEAIALIDELIKAPPLPEPSIYDRPG